MQDNPSSDTNNVPVKLPLISSSSDSPLYTDAPTHLANERTFLAWSLMGIIIIGSGVALTRAMIALNTTPIFTTKRTLYSLFRPTTMGLLFIASGVVIIVMAAYRFLVVQEQINEHRYRPSGTLAMVLLTLILALSILLIGFLLHQGR